MNATKTHRPSRWDVPYSVELGMEEGLTDSRIEKLLSQPPFSDIDRDGFRKSLPLEGILRNDVAIRNYEPGDIIIRRDDWGNSAFFILEGSVRVELESDHQSLTDELLGHQKRKRKTFFQSVAQLWKNNRESETRKRKKDPFSSSLGLRQNQGARQIYLQDVSVVLDHYRTAQMNAGQWFGELAALGRTSRVATVFSEGESQLLEIRWQGLRDIMRFDQDGKLKTYIEEVFRERALESFLRNHELFRQCSQELMRKIVEKCEFQSYGDYDSPKPFQVTQQNGHDPLPKNEPVIVEEGDYLNGVVLIRNGVARLSQIFHHGRKTIGYLTAGQMTGLSEFLNHSEADESRKYPARLSATGYLNVVLIPSRFVEQILQERTDNEFQIESRNGVKSHVEPNEPFFDESFLNFLVDRKYVQGTSLMVIDLDKCTRCDDCVKACATAHDNNPRFIRHGPVHGHYQIPNSCLHCSDPVCMIECPTGAIGRDQVDGSILINEQTCIGCAQCANNCPFDAIRMVSVRDGKGNILVDSQNQKPIMEATKCDQCVDQIGPPACQQACPYDALVRVDMQNIHHSGKVPV